MTKPPIIEAADQPREYLLGHVVIAFADLLAHDFEESLLERADHAAGEKACPLGQSAEAAHRITTLCRQLQVQVARYERFDRMCRDAEADRRGGDEADSGDLPF